MYSAQAPTISPPRIVQPGQSSNPAVTSPTYPTSAFNALQSRQVTPAGLERGRQLIAALTAGATAEGPGSGGTATSIPLFPNDPQYMLYVAALSEVAARRGTNLEPAPTDRNIAAGRIAVQMKLSAFAKEIEKTTGNKPTATDLNLALSNIIATNMGYAAEKHPGILQSSTWMSNWQPAFLVPNFNRIEQTQEWNNPSSELQTRVAAILYPHQHPAGQHPQVVQRAPAYDRPRLQVGVGLYSRPYYDPDYRPYHDYYSAAGLRIGFGGDNWHVGLSIGSRGPGYYHRPRYPIYDNPIHVVHHNHWGNGHHGRHGHHMAMGRHHRSAWA